MPIICNSRCLNATLTGTQRYTQRILDAFPKNFQLASPSPSFSRGFKGHLWEQFILPLKIKNQVLWSPSNSGPLSVRKQVVTIHDVVSIDHPEWFHGNYVKWYNYMLPRLCKKVDHIIAISEFTRQRLIEKLGLPESKITMVHNGSDAFPKTLETDVAPQLPFKRFILSLGSLEPRKNIPMLLNAWKNILHKVPDDIGLIVVGGIGNHRIFKDAGISEMPPRTFFTGHVEDSYIKYLYNNAMFFVYLSVYEGFGLPPVEAMSVGTPVLTGNRASLPEVVGDGGMLVDPYSLTECQEGILKMINDESLRHVLAEKAVLQAKRFDWGKTAMETLNVLQRFE